MSKARGLRGAFGQAEEQGHPQALGNPGMMLATGKGVEPDAQQAALWWQQAA